MLILKNEHIGILEYSTKVDFFQRVRAKLQKFDARAAKVPEPELDAFIQRQYDVAKQHDFSSEKQCMVWIFVTWVWGENLIENHDYLKVLMENHMADSDAKSDALWRWHIQQDLLKKEESI